MLKCFKFSHGSNAVAVTGKNMLKCFQIRVFNSNFGCTAQMNLLLTASPPIDCACEQLRSFWKWFHVIPLAGSHQWQGGCWRGKAGVGRRAIRWQTTAGSLQPQLPQSLRSGLVKLCRAVNVSWPRPFQDSRAKFAHFPSLALVEWLSLLSLLGLLLLSLLGFMTHTLMWPAVLTSTRGRNLEETALTLSHLPLQQRCWYQWSTTMVNNSLKMKW